MASLHPHNAADRAAISRSRELLELATGLLDRLTGSDTTPRTYSVGPGGVWTVQRICAASPPCKDAAHCHHDRPPRPLEGAIVPAGEWRPALELVRGVTEVPRKLTPWTMADHLRGRYWIAPEATSWTSWIALDIDAHAGQGAGPAEVRAARARRDRTLAAVWRACGFDETRQPLILRTPGDGYHLWLPLTRDDSVNPEHTWPSAWAREWMTRHLARAGVPLGNGSCEVYPSGRRLRAPCGRRMILLQPTSPRDPDALGLVPWPGTTITRADGSVERRVVPTAQAFIAAWDAQRRPLSEWLQRSSARWDRTWAFFVGRPGSDVGDAPELAPVPGPAEKNGGQASRRGCDPSQQIDAVPGPPGAADPDRSGGASAVGQGGRRSRRRAGEGGSASSSPSCATPPASDFEAPPAGESTGKLVRGADYWRKVTRLLAEGVTAAGSRHDAVLTLTFYWACSGLTDGQVLVAMEDWARAHAHVGDAATRGTFVQECLAASRSYLASRGHLWKRGGGVRQRVACGALEEADRAVLRTMAPAVALELGALLAFLAGQPRTAEGRPRSTVELAGGLLSVLCPDRRVWIDGQRRRAVVVAIEELVRTGILALHTDAAVGSHGRIYHCWYRFGSGELPREVPITAAQWAEAAPPVAPPTTPEAPLQEADPIVVAIESGALQQMRLLGERIEPEGRLWLVSDGTRTPPRVLLPDGEPPSIRPRPAGGTWWARMFRYRGFTPAEWEAATQTTVPLTARARPIWARRRPPPPPMPPTTGPPVGAEVVRGPPSADPRAELAQVLGASLPGDLDPDLAAVALRALAGRDRSRSGW